jgi:two-component system, LytTR family, response regulator
METKLVPSQPKPIRALVVDDEAPARTRLTDLLAKDPDFGPALQAENGVAAVALIQKAKPDIVFLDMQMPDVGGLGVIDAIGADNMPLTVFVTAFDRFALQAFEADAIDYLLKPFGDKRFEGAIDRLKSRLHDLRSRNSNNADCFGPELLKLVEKRSQPGELWEWIVVKSRETTRLVMADDIDWIEGAGVYVTVHAKGQEFCHRGGLAAIASRLDPSRFVRIHRSSIVNLRSVDYLERRSHGEFDVMLKGGAQLMVSRSYRSHLEAMLGQRL